MDYYNVKQVMVYELFFNCFKQVNNLRRIEDLRRTECSFDKQKYNLWRINYGNIFDRMKRNDEIQKV